MLLRAQPDGAANPFASLGNLAKKIRLRPGQSIPLVAQEPFKHYLLAKGWGIVEAEWPHSRRVVFAMLAPGDVAACQPLPPATSARLTATVPAEVLIIGTASDERAAREDGAHGKEFCQGLLAFQARIVLHHAMIAGLNAQERLATFLVDLALRQGSAGHGTVSMQFSRSDMADYLALNADTLSRLLSQLRAKGIIQRPRRDSLVIRDWNALSAMSPLAESLEQLAAQSDPSRT